MSSVGYRCAELSAYAQAAGADAVPHKPLLSRDIAAALAARA